MIKLPLFGKDSSPHRTSLFLSGIITLIIWIAFIIISKFIKFEKKYEKYETVRIVLESTPPDEIEDDVEENIEKTVENNREIQTEEFIEEEIIDNTFFEEQIPVIEEEIAVNDEIIPKIEQIPQKEVKKQEVPALNENRMAAEKSAPIKNETVETAPVTEKNTTEAVPSESIKQPESVEDKSIVSKDEIFQKEVETIQNAVNPNPVSYDLVKTPEELMEEQLNKAKQKKEVDWDALFGDESSSTSVSNNTNTSERKVQNESQTLGKAAGTVTEGNQKKKSEKQNQNKNDGKSSDTAKKIEDILKATSISENDNTKESFVTKMQTPDSIVMEMEDGSIRSLIYPKHPEINLSKEAVKTIDSDKTVKISFKIYDSGFITDIKISPESILSQIVAKEIKEQISKWQFEPTDNISVASFEYNIKQKK